MENCRNYSRYKERLAFIEALGKRNKSDITVRGLNTVAKDIEEDISYITTSEWLPAFIVYYFKNTVHVRDIHVCSVAHVICVCQLLAVVVIQYNTSTFSFTGEEQSVL